MDGTDAHPNPGTPPAGDAALLAATLSAYDARLKQVEDKVEDRTVFGRVQKKTSFIALVIGIVLSGISLFDVFWSKPREALFRDVAEFNKAVNAVASLRQNALQMQFQNQNANPQMMMAMNSMITPQVLANIQYATALLPRLDEHVGIPQLTVLIYEAMNIYDWDNARKLVDRAVAIEDAVPALKSEARRYKARLLFMTGKPQEGRAAFQDALNVLSAEKSYGISGARAYIVRDWIISEYTMGDCELGNERVRQFVEFVKQPQISEPARAGLIATVKSEIDQVQSQQARCPVPAVLQGLAPR